MRAKVAFSGVGGRPAEELALEPEEHDLAEEGDESEAEDSLEKVARR